MAPHASAVKSTVNDWRRKWLTGRNATVAAKRISSPPIVGTPCFAK